MFTRAVGLRRRKISEDTELGVVAKFKGAERRTQMPQGPRNNLREEGTSWSVNRHQLASDEAQYPSCQGEAVYNGFVDDWTSRITAKIGHLGVIRAGGAPPSSVSCWPGRSPSPAC